MIIPSDTILYYSMLIDIIINIRMMALLATTHFPESIVTSNDER